VKRFACCLLLLSVLSALLCLSCKNPFGYEPDDPTKTDPPAPPVQTEPEDGKLIRNYAYPQDVVMKWQPVTGASYYQVEVYRDSTARAENLYRMVDNIRSTQTSVTFGRYGWYCWRVRAYSPNWKWYTDWSPLHEFILPNPVR